MRRALIAMALLLALAFPFSRPPGTSVAVTIGGVLTASMAAAGLLLRLATPLAVLRLATYVSLVIMTAGLVDSLDVVADGGVLGVRYLAFATLQMVLALFAFGPRAGVLTSLAMQALWLALIANHPHGEPLLRDGGPVQVAGIYAVVLLILLWGVLRSHALLQAERDTLADEAREARSERRDRMEREQERARLMAEAAHELRAPLATIEAGAHTLDAYDEELEASMRRRVLEAMRNAASRLDRRTLELLDAARDRVTAVPAARVDVDAADVVARCLADLGLLTTAHRLEADLERPAPARLDPDGLDHILTNLVHNAVKYSPTGTTITVSLRREADTTVLVVADAGPGVPPAVRDDLFTPWARAAEHEQVDGTGVGLAVARTWARRHGGDVRLLDTDVGAAFEVRLPDEHDADLSPAT